MEIADRAVKREKTAIKFRSIAIAALWFLLSSPGANVCAQTIASGDRVIAPALHPAVSEFETSAVWKNPPASFIEKNIRNTGTGEVASNGRIIVDSATTQDGAAFIQSGRRAQFTDQSNGAMEKVTATRTEKPPGTRMPNSVTLWDEIAPPVPAPVPVDAAARATPSDVANSGARRTQ